MCNLLSTVYEAVVVAICTVIVLNSAVKTSRTCKRQNILHPHSNEKRVSLQNHSTLVCVSQRLKSPTACRTSFCTSIMCWVSVRHNSVRVIHRSDKDDVAYNAHVPMSARISVFQTVPRVKFVVRQVVL